MTPWMSFLVRRLWAVRVFDELALIEQPLALNRLCVALIIFGSSPTKRKGARRRVDAHAQLSRAGAGRDPTPSASAMRIANGEHARRIAPSGIIAAQGFENVPLGEIQAPLFDLNRSIRQLRVGPQQTAKVGAGDAKFF